MLWGSRIACVIALRKQRATLPISMALRDGWPDESLKNAKAKRLRFAVFDVTGRSSRDRPISAYCAGNAPKIRRIRRHVTFYGPPCATIRAVPWQDQDPTRRFGLGYRGLTFSVAKGYTHAVSVLMDAPVSIVSNNLNVLMKTLTIITLGIMVPTLVVSIFSMNVPIPFQEHGFSFWMIVALAVGSAVGVMAFWRYKKFW
jgi:hypothetical protein